jgi:RNA polymerase sigma-70 factor (subfamily 1)
MPPSDSDSFSAPSVVLVRRAQEGDRSALNRLFERYYERVRRIVRLRLGKHLRTTCDSGDLLQETFIAAVKSFEEFEVRDEASLINWLSKIAEHRVRAAADRMNAQMRDPRREVAMEQVRAAISSGEIRLEPPASLPLPIDALADEEEMQRIEACLGDLKEEYREVILLRYYAGASWETAAALMGRPSAAACRMLHARALAELTTRVQKRSGR